MLFFYKNGLGIKCPTNVWYVINQRDQVKLLVMNELEIDK